MMARESGHSQRSNDALRAEDVAAFLRLHPDFLIQHGDLIACLTPPTQSRGPGVVDFQHFMVERLRRDLEASRTQYHDLVLTSRATLNGQSRIHAAVLRMLDATSFEQLIQTITTDLALLLDLDVTSLVVESNGSDHAPVNRSGVRVVMPGTVMRWLGIHNILVQSDIEGEPTLFGPGAGLVRSMALLRLRISPETPEGVLALGSRDPVMFPHSTGTELLNFLARAVERSIRGWLDLPA
ncbi:MAG: DUF484 family protein [Azospirillaceae bacterium]|nr:DUF484 family protein [Azospirillaceae bacterium]